MTDALDWTKPIQTRDGRKARVWDEPLSDGRRVVVVTSNGTEDIAQYLPHGELACGGDMLECLDIINAPEPERWLVFHEAMGGVWITGEIDSEADARKQAESLTKQAYIAKLIPVAPEKENDDG